ncbi:MAG: alpha-2-macroglobulin [Pseudomonadota bacterium]
MSALRSVFGVVRWERPGWLGQHAARRLGIFVGAVVFIAVAGVAVSRYLDSLPKPAMIVASLTAPGVTPVVNDAQEPAPLVIDFTVNADPRSDTDVVTSVAAIESVGKRVTDGVRIQPAIAGQWRWVSENQLIFDPEADWPAGQKYTVSFEASLFSPNLALGSKRESFETPAFAAAVSELSFYQDPVASAERKVVATLTFSHPVDPESLQNNLSYLMRASDATVTAPKTQIDYELTFDTLKRVAYVHSAPIEIPAAETYVTLQLDRALAPQQGSSGLADKISENVLIPTVDSYFRVADARAVLVRDEDDNPRQAITLEFTDRVAVDALQRRIQAYVLPVNVTIDGRRVTRKRWSSPREVTPEVLAQAEQVTLVMNAAQGGSAMVHSAPMDVGESRSVYLRVESGLTSDGEFALSVPAEHVLRVPSYPKETRIAQTGAVLPLTSSKKLTLLSRGVRTLKVDVGRLIDGQINHLASQTYGDMSNPTFSGYQFSEENITDRQTTYIDVNAKHPSEAVYASVDLGRYAQDGGHYFVTVQGWDRDKQRVIGSRDKRFVLVTDLGMLVKSNSDSTQDVFVHSIRSGAPVAGASVELLGKNGIPVVSRTTTADGHVRLPSVADYRREKSPTVFVVRNGSDAVFMPYSRNDRRLQYSRFNVGGEYVQQRDEAGTLSAQLFSDRGLYRPGDTARFGGIVKRSDWQPVGGLPLELEITDTRGQRVLQQLFSLPADGFFENALSTEATSSTGSYSATLFLINANGSRRALGSTSFQVEEFQPDRLRISAQIAESPAAGWLKPQDLACEVSLQNLFGTPAQSRRVNGNVTLQPSTMRFAAYPGFVFDDPLRDGSTNMVSQQIALAATTTDENGIARLPLDLSQYDKGAYRLSVATEGFEEGGGRSVKAIASAMMSPLDYMVGYKLDGDVSFIGKEAERSVRFVAVDSNAQSIALDALRVSIVEQSFVSTLVKRANGTFAYQSVLKETTRSERAFSLGAEGQQFTLPTETPGDFVVRLTGEDGLVYSNVAYSVAGARNLAGNLERDAELSLKLDGSSFNAGDVIELQMTAPYTGTGLITIERDRVYAYQWFTADENTSVQRIRIPETLEGNAYVNVAFIRDIDSPELFVSPLSYAVQPFSINRAARTVEIELDVVDKVMPGTPLNVSYSASEPARVVIYAVDVGILQVANYALPDPLSFFLRKKALQVDTFQIADLLLPDFDAYRRAAAPGGGDAADLVGRNLNPFRRKSEAPVAFWSGIIDAGPQQRTVTFDIPDYFSGELRVMAVAVADGALGNASTRLVARGPFVITPNVLTAVAPGDEFDVTVGVANSMEGETPTDALTLTASSSDHVQIVGDTTQQLTIAPGAEGRATFRARALTLPGNASLDFVVEGGSVSMRRSATFSVRPSVPYVTTSLTGTSSADPVSLAFDRSMFDQLSAQRVAASASPLVLTDGLFDYLATFPHACAEQIVSKVFPQIGFLDRGDAAVDAASIRRVFDRTIATLRRRQTSQGGFRFWVSSPEPAAFASVYITHFLTDAKSLGLSVPRDMLASAVDYLRVVAAREVTNLADARLRAYAIYVLTRNAIVTTGYLTNLHEYLDGQTNEAWDEDLTSTYMAASYQLLKQSGLGARLVDKYVMSAGDEMTSDFDTRLGRDAQHVYLLARHFPDALSGITSENLRSLAEPIMQNRFNTLSAAYTVMALGEYTRASTTAEGETVLRVLAEINGVPTALNDAAPFARASVANGTTDIQVAGAQGRDVYYVLTQSGFDRELPAAANASGIELFREYLDASGAPVTTAMIGDELTVRLRVRSTGQPRSNVAVIDMLPGGFEVMTESLRGTYGGWSPDYKDIREDRVVFYGSFSDRITEFSYKVKLTSSGDFVIPAAYAGSMYDLSIQANTLPGRFEVRSVR